MYIQNISINYRMKPVGKIQIVRQILLQRYSNLKNISLGKAESKFNDNRIHSRKCLKKNRLITKKRIGFILKNAKSRLTVQQGKQ